MTDDQKPWDASQPLRADATDEQIEDREEYLCDHHGPGPHNRADGSGCFACARVAREFAAVASCARAVSAPPELASSGSTGAPTGNSVEQEDREKLWTLFAMKGGWVEPSAFADDVLKTLGRA